MKIDGINFDFQGATNVPITVPDCWVVGKNKLGKGHGEAKLYISKKEEMDSLFSDCISENIPCFVLKNDLFEYMNSIESYYKNPKYLRGDCATKQSLNELWLERMNLIKQFPNDFIYFEVQKQNQITGPRGYINSKDKNNAYHLIRKIALGDISYISIMRLTNPKGETVFYWKLFADFHEMEKRVLFIENYGKKEIAQKNASISQQSVANVQSFPKGRPGQSKYRDDMLEECSMCFITQITEESLLIASHIKPFAVCTEKERYDANNGFILSPLYDKLFDKGFITFTDDKRVLISNWLYPRDKERIGIKDNQFFSLMPLNSTRCSYLEYHRKYVFKG